MELTKTSGSGITEEINMSGDKDLRAWANKFDVTKVKLKAAVNAVGNYPKHVESYLKRIAGSNLQRLSRFNSNL
jgi:hypothetical protein